MHLLMIFGRLWKGWYNCPGSCESLAVFSTIDYSILLDWLQWLGVGSTISHDQFQLLLMSEERSVSRLLQCGLPQGSGVVMGHDSDSRSNCDSIAVAKSVD